MSDNFDEDVTHVVMNRRYIYKRIVIDFYIPFLNPFLMKRIKFFLPFPFNEAKIVGNYNFL